MENGTIFPRCEGALGSRSSVQRFSRQQPQFFLALGAFPQTYTHRKACIEQRVLASSRLLAHFSREWLKKVWTHGDHRVPHDPDGRPVSRSTRRVPCVCSPGPEPNPHPILYQSHRNPAVESTEGKRGWWWPQGRGKLRPSPTCNLARTVRLRSTSVVLAEPVAFLSVPFLFVSLSRQPIVDGAVSFEEALRRHTKFMRRNSCLPGQRRSCFFITCGEKRKRVCRYLYCCALIATVLFPAQCKIFSLHEERLPLVRVHAFGKHPPA